MADLHRFPCGHHVTRKRLAYTGGPVAVEIETCLRCDAERRRSVGRANPGEWAPSPDHAANVNRALDVESAKRNQHKKERSDGSL